MTPLDQVTEIIKLLSPEDTNQTDAVYLVTTTMRKLKALIQSQQNQIALLEAQINDLQTNLKDMINQKLEAQSEARALKKLKVEKTELPEEDQTPRDNPKPKGKTL